MFILDHKFVPGIHGIQLSVNCNEVQTQEFRNVLWHLAQNNTESSVTYLHALKNMQIMILPRKVFTAYYHQPLQYYYC